RSGRPYIRLAGSIRRLYLSSVSRGSAAGFIPRGSSIRHSGFKSHKRQGGDGRGSNHFLASHAFHQGKRRKHRRAGQAQGPDGRHRANVDQEKVRNRVPARGGSTAPATPATKPLGVGQTSNFPPRCYIFTPPL